MNPRWSRCFWPGSAAPCWPASQAAQTRDLATAPAAAARPGIAAMLAASPAEAWQHGTAGMYDHRHAVALPWGFTPAEVGLPGAALGIAELALVRAWQQAGPADRAPRQRRPVLHG